ncbi:MAG TPA: VOC family protein [Terriglobales bacterium]|nr:VOC family protein [Terriglobales bacterium]
MTLQFERGESGASIAGMVLRSRLYGWMLDLAAMAQQTLKAMSPSMEMARVILFTGQMDAMSKFYGEVLGLKQVSSEKGWREFAAGGARIALHSGPSSPGRKGPKIAFYAKDVAAVRETLVARGARFGKVRQGEMFCLCDGKDPDGNPIQLSDR